jgi:hypothetical protein
MVRCKFDEEIQFWCHVIEDPMEKSLNGIDVDPHPKDCKCYCHEENKKCY